MADFRGKDLRYCACVRVSARKAQRVASLCKKLKNMPTFMPISCKIVTKMVSKPIPKVWQIVPKSIKSRGCVADVFLERFGIAPRCQKSLSPWEFRRPLVTVFDHKEIKWCRKRHLKILAEKISKINTKSHSKCGKNWCWKRNIFILSANMWKMWIYAAARVGARFYRFRVPETAPKNNMKCIQNRYQQKLCENYGESNKIELKTDPKSI